MHLSLVPLVHEPGGIAVLWPFHGWVACECVLLPVLGCIVETRALLLVISHVGAFLIDLHAL